ncbi:MAG: phage portal protein [Planctomycetota bacterium]
MSEKPGILARVKAAASLVVKGDVGPSGWAMLFGQSKRGNRPIPTRPYRDVGVVYACVRMRAQAVSALPLRTSTLDDQLIESGPLVDLAECPHRSFSGRNFWQHTEAFLALFGRCHWVMELSGIGRPMGLMPVSPLSMREDVDRATGLTRGWWYRPPRAVMVAEQYLPADQVHTLVEPDFGDPSQVVDGLGALEAVRQAAHQYFAADAANLALLENGVAPSGMIRVKGDLTERQEESLRRQMHDRHAGASARHGFMIGTGGIEWQQMGAALKDMEFAVLKRRNEVAICSGFGVPPALVGIFEDSNYAHAEAAQEAFWMNTILPRAA